MSATKRAKLDLFKNIPFHFSLGDYTKSILIQLRYNKKK